MKKLFLSALLCTTLSGKSVVYFTPDDRPLRPLTTLLRHAQKRILVATYQFSHRVLAQQLCAAKARGCIVEVVVDGSTLAMENNVVPMLQEATIPVFVYHAPRGNNLCHHKYAVIDDEVWSGSMNWTYRGMKHNQENAIHCDEAPVTQRYAQQFALLKKRCEQLAPLHPSPTKKDMWSRLKRSVSRLLDW